MLQIADYIIPGHGPMFKVPEKFKKNMQIVFYEEYTEFDDGNVAQSSEYHVMFEDVTD